jgi:hypothetical protein
MSDLALSPNAASGRFPRLAEPLRRFLRDWSDHYRPELYYMRGPGPKWREKHPADSTAPNLHLHDPR